METYLRVELTMFLSTILTSKTKSLILRKIPGTHSYGTRMSDHKAVIFTLDIHETTRGPGNWKLNISHLENKDYQTEVKQIIQNIKNMKETSIQQLKNLKYDVKNFSI